MLFSDKYNRQDFINFFSVDFLPEDFIAEPQTIDFDFKSKYFKTDGVTYIGKSESLDLAVYEIKHSSENDARIGLSRDAFKLVSNYFENNALVLFVPEKENNYRLSLVTIEHKLDAKGVRVLKEYSNPKRYSYFLGEDAKTHTPEQYLLSLGRVTDIDDLKKRFSVEVVNKEFYSKIAGMFSKLVGGKRKRGSKTVSYEPQLRLPSYPVDRFEKKYKEFAVRLIGRTVFCWFLKKKKSDTDIPLIPEDVLSHFAVNMYPDYYHSRVEPLFFEVLNTQTEKRKPEYKEKPYHTIPFLNGGLFEPHHDDFYVTGKPNYALKVPDEWWKEFIEILETYNFTIDENTSIDIDLSVDPEMLGRIFENLLAEINPETGETARKSTGSYYTPRPIVEYMVDESLKQHIITKTNLPEDKITPLLDYSIEESGLTGEEENLVKTALDDIKVLDPACGSGAFPMGILQKMLLILQKVDYSAENSIRNILKDIKDPMYRKLFEAKLMEDDDLDDYARKLNIIRRSIYGIDIQPIATEISKLRFFLSIIVDEKIQDDQKNRGIEPLPNLEFKFVCANTLIPLPPNRELFENADTIEELEKLREEYFLSYGNDKKELRKEFEKIQRKLFSDANINLFTREVGEHNIEKQTQSSLLANWKPFGNESTPWFDAKWMFGVNKGFDVVIGNPPYIQMQKDKGKLAKVFAPYNYKTFARTGDIYSLFYEKSIMLLKDKGISTLITSSQWMRAAYGLGTRKYFLKNNPLKLIQLGPGVFDMATVDTNILIIEKNRYEKKLKGITVEDIKTVNPSLNKKLLDLSYLNIDDWVILNPTEYQLRKKLLTKGTQLKDWHLSIYRGVLTGYNDAFIIPKDKAEELIGEDDKLKEIIKPILKGREIKKYLNDWKGAHIINTHNGYQSESGITIAPINVKKDYPILWKYFNNYENKLLEKKNIDGKTTLISERADQGWHWTNMRNCAYLEEFENEKLVWKRIGSQIRFSYSNGETYCLDSTCIATGEKIKYLLGFLNSKLVRYQLLENAPRTGMGDLILSVQAIEPLHVYYPKPEEEKIIVDLTKQIIHEKQHGINADTRELENQIDLTIYKLYSLTYEEVKIVDPEFGMSEEEYEGFEIE